MNQPILDENESGSICFLKTCQKNSKRKWRHISSKLTFFCVLGRKVCEAPVGRAEKELSSSEVAQGRGCVCKGGGGGGGGGALFVKSRAKWTLFSLAYFASFQA